jgi:hypothetical protein
VILIGTAGARRSALSVAPPPPGAGRKEGAKDSGPDERPPHLRRRDREQKKD